MDLNAGNDGLETDRTDRDEASLTNPDKNGGSAETVASSEQLAPQEGDQSKEEALTPEQIQAKVEAERLAIVESQLYSD